MTVDIEDQIHRLADAAFADTAPVPIPARVDGPVRQRSRRWVPAAAASIVVGLLAALLIMVGGSQSTEPADPVPPVVDLAEGFSAQGAFAEMPFGEFGSSIQVSVSAVDLDDVADLVGIERSGFVFSETKWANVLLSGSPTPDESAIVALPVSGPFLDALREPELAAEEFGWSGSDLSAVVGLTVFGPFAEAPGYPPSFDVVRLDSDVAALTERAASDGIVDIGVGEDGEQNGDGRNALEPLGRPLRLAPDADRSLVAVSLTRPAAQDFLEDGAPSLLDDPDARVLAEELDRSGDLYALDVRLGGFRDGSQADFEALREDGNPFQLDDLVITERFDAFGIGWSGVGDTARTSIVYVFETSEAAGASVGAIEDLFRPGADFTDESFQDEDRRMGDVFELDTVLSSGRAVVVLGRTAQGAEPLDLAEGLRQFGPWLVRR